MLETTTLSRCVTCEARYLEGVLHCEQLSYRSDQCLALGTALAALLTGGTRQYSCIVYVSGPPSHGWDGLLWRFRASHSSTTCSDDSKPYMILKALDES